MVVTSTIPVYIDIRNIRDTHSVRHSRCPPFPGPPFRGPPFPIRSVIPSVLHSRVPRTGFVSKQSNYLLELFGQNGSCKSFSFSMLDDTVGESCWEYYCASICSQNVKTVLLDFNNSFRFRSLRKPGTDYYFAQNTKLLRSSRAGKSNTKSVDHA